GERHDLWIGTEAGGLFRLDTRTGKAEPYGTAAGLSVGVYALGFDEEHRLWVGTSAGLFRSTAYGDRLHFEPVVIPSQPFGTIYALILDGGNIWAATQNGGLLHCNKGKWTQYRTKEGLANDQLIALGRGRNGSV